MFDHLMIYQDSATQELAACSDAASLEAWRIAHLGTKGRLKGLM